MNGDGSQNTVVGAGALGGAGSGDYNTAVGVQAMNANTGSQNTAVGVWAGTNNTGDNSVFLGYRAGEDNVTDNVLYIDNSDDPTPLIYGDFSTDEITINGDIAVTGGATVGGDTVVTTTTDLGYTLQAKAFDQINTLDSQTVYWGSGSLEPSTTADRWRIYIPQTGIITSVYIYSYANTSGSNENWSMYIRYDNTTDTLVQTLGVSASGRTWSNTGLNIAVTQGHYIEIKEIQPAWATNPDTVSRTAVIYVKG
jgi:hypothetical protein